MTPRAFTSLRWLTGVALAWLSMSCGDSLGGAGSGGATSSGGGAAAPLAGSPAIAGTSSAGGAASGGGAPSGGSAGDANSGGTTPLPNAGAPSSSGGNGGSSGGAGTSGGGGSSGGAGASSGATIVPDPSWTCGKPDGIVDPTRGKLVFSASFDVGQVRQVGATQFGERRVTDLTGGAIDGDQLEATLLPGGIDSELKLANGAIELEQVAMLRAKDNSLIYLRTCGVAPAGESVVRIVPDFEVATSSSLAWLNDGKFVGARRLDATAKKVELSVYDVSAVASDGPRIELEDPAGAQHQPWECMKASGTRGSEVFTETVTLGSSLSVGASKRGTRNVIPITGGTVSGQLTGKVVSAGADYQLIGGSTILDARYLLAADNGEFVVVRNCGPFGALIPLFEARSAGPYAFLNTGKFISSDPGSAAGGVKITFYELE